MREESLDLIPTATGLSQILNTNLYQSGIFPQYNNDNNNNDIARMLYEK